MYKYQLQFRIYLCHIASTIVTIEGDWRAVIYHDVTPRSTENSVRYLTFKAGRFLEDLGKAPVGELLVDILGSEGDDIMTMAIERYAITNNSSVFCQTHRYTE